jgi:hypothetical protein
LYGNALRVDARPPARIEIRRWLDSGKIADQEQRASDLRVVRGTPLTLEEVPLHRDDVFPRKNIIDERDVLTSKTATIHRRQDPHEWFA